MYAGSGQWPDQLDSSGARRLAPEQDPIKLYIFLTVLGSIGQVLYNLTVCLISRL